MMVAGFIIAVGLQIITEQLPKALGYTAKPPEGGTFIDHFEYVKAQCTFLICLQC